MNPFWLLRMKKWAVNPPSWKQVIFVVAIVLVCLGLFGVERIWGWPDWLTPENARAPARVR